MNWNVLDQTRTWTKSLTIIYDGTIVSLPCSYLSPTMILNIYVRNSSLFTYFLQFRNKISWTLILLSGPCQVSNVVHLPHLTQAAHSRSWSYFWRFQSGYCPQRCDVGPPPGHWKWEDLWQPSSQPHPRTTPLEMRCPPDLWQSGGLASYPEPQDDVPPTEPTNHDAAEKIRDGSTSSKSTTSS